MLDPAEQGAVRRCVVGDGVADLLAPAPDVQIGARQVATSVAAPGTAERAPAEHDQVVTARPLHRGCRVAGAG